MFLISEAGAEVQQWLYNIWMVLKVLIGFSVIIFFHELGHFLAAKWVGIRVNGFVVGFGPRIVGYRSGEGLTFGNRPDYSADEVNQRGYGETDYSLRLLPIGGYVKMLGQDDIEIDEKTNQIKLSDDPRAFPSRPVGQRMLVVSAGVIFNLIFAAALLTGVFLIGRTDQAPQIGIIPPDSPARGKLMTGDTVLEVEGRQINSFKDLMVGSIIAGDEVELVVDRDGQRVGPIVVPTTLREEVGLRILEIDPFRDPILAEDIPAFDDRPTPRKGDYVTEVNGKPIESYADIIRTFWTSKGRAVQLTVNRPIDGDKTNTTEETCYLRPMLDVSAMRRAYSKDEQTNADTTAHLLGLVRRQGINRVLPDSAADEAGFKQGDIILQFGDVAHPLYHEVISVIKSNPGEAIPVRVKRGEEVVELQVKPRRRFQLFSEGKPTIGVEFRPEHEPIVATVMPDTPAAALEIPRGARIVGINDIEINNWSELAEQLLLAAGQQVTIKYLSGTSIVGRPMQVPGSLWNEIGLDPLTQIEMLDGEKTFVTSNPFTKNEMQARFGSSSWAVREYLKGKVGETVEVAYRPSPTSEEIRKATFAVTADNCDPWQMRLRYRGQGLNYLPKEIEINAGGNPAVALSMGVNEVKNWVMEVYAFLQAMVSRNNVTVEHVSGPVGIVSVAVERAKAGMVELLYFIAFLSVNLAVINFLPIPVMDGGQMVFLIIEKVKGKPLSLNTQIVSTLVGLVAILLLGLIVTFQDIGRLFE